MAAAAHAAEDDVFEVFRDETYGRRNLVAACLLVLVIVGGPLALWAAFGPGVFVAMAGVAGIALVGGFVALFWMTPTGGLWPDDDAGMRRKAERRRRNGPHFHG